MAPAYRPVGLPVTATTTGNVALPELDEATMPTDVTSPNTGVLAPVGVIVTWSPFCTLATSPASTVASTTYDPVLMTWMSVPDEPVEPFELEPLDPVDDPDPLDPLDPLAPLDPLEPLEPLEPLPPLDPLPETCSPTVTPTAVTVPLIGDVSVAPASAASASTDLSPSHGDAGRVGSDLLGGRAGRLVGVQPGLGRCQARLGLCHLADQGRRRQRREHLPLRDLLALGDAAPW